MKNRVFLFLYFFIFFVLTNLNGQSDPFIKKFEEKTYVFSIFPNPLTQGILYFESTDTGIKEISIFNILGDKIFSVNTFEKSIDLNLLSKGIYFLELRQGKKRGIKRLVVP